MPPGRAPRPWRELAALIDQGVLEIRIADTYPLDGVRDAFAELEARNTRRGKDRPGAVTASRRFRETTESRSVRVSGSRPDETGTQVDAR